MVFFLALGKARLSQVLVAHACELKKGGSQFEANQANSS
jgi:hypothetical protein